MGALQLLSPARAKVQRRSQILKKVSDKEEETQHGGGNGNQRVLRPQEAVHLLRLVSQRQCECWNPPSLHLEPGLVRDGFAAHARRLCPGSHLLGLPSPPWRGAHHLGHHHHRHLCCLLPDDGPCCWRTGCSPHACAQPVDLQPSSSWLPRGRIPSLASCSRLPYCCLDCAVHWPWRL